MAYTVDYTDGTKTAITVANSAVDTTTNLGLVGQGYKNFGEVIAENFLHLLENFAATTAPSKPVEGQMWYDTANNEMKYFDDVATNSGNWKSLAVITVQAEEPAGNGEQDGHLWLDTDTGVLNVLHNGSWVSMNDIPGDTQFISRTRYDVDGLTHRTIETVVSGVIVSIFASDAEWTPSSSGTTAEYLEDGTTLLTTQFPTITPGVTLNNDSTFFFTGTATLANYADLAERYHADAKYPYGTVVKIGGAKEITQTDSVYCSDVFGVISDNPAFAMNSGAGTAETHPYVALSGRVPVRVVGKVKKGQRLVSSSTPGHAMAVERIGIQYEYVIGRALEDKINDAPGIVEVVVGTK